MTLRSSMIIDYVAGRLDEASARDIERASKLVPRLAEAIVEAQALHRRMRTRLSIDRAGGAAAYPSRHAH